MNRHKSLWSAWETTARKKPKKILFIDAASGLSLTAAQLTEQALSLAAFPTKRLQGKTIAFCLPNGPEWLAVFLAIQQAGGAALPLDAGLLPASRKNAAQTLGAHYYWEGGEWHPLPPCKKKTPALNRGQKNPAIVKVTSGTTGQGKAIFCGASHLLHDGMNILRTMKIRPEDRNLGLIPFGHSYGLGNLLMPLLLQGTGIVTAASWLPAQIPGWIRQHGCTVFPSVPPVFRYLAETPTLSSLPGLRLAISAGAVLPAETARLFQDRFHLPIHNFYGSSETGGICYDRTGSATREGRSVGKPLIGVNLRLAGQTVWVSGSAVATPSGRHRLPDLARWNKRGELELLGRRDNAVNIGGKKVHPEEIAALLRGLDGVSEAHVLKWKNGHREGLAAAVESRRTVRELSAALCLALPPWKIPRHWVVRAQLPRTDRGKLDVSKTALLLNAAH
jgi:acyl-CoA synthetase (AMP-forming)/AMP-acid ligase II